MVGDAVGDVLQQHRLAGARRRDDQAALPLADRHHQVHDARRQVVGRGLELDALLRVERRQVLEEHPLADAIGRLEVDRLDLDQREVALALLRLPDLAADRVAGLQVELANLRGGDVDVVGTGQVVVVGRAEEAEAVGQRLEHPFREEVAALLGAAAEDLEDQLLLAHPGGAGHVQRLGDLGQLADAHLLQRREVDLGFLAGRAGLRLAPGVPRVPLRLPAQSCYQCPQIVQSFAASLPRSAGRPFRVAVPVPSGFSRARCVTACRFSSRAARARHVRATAASSRLEVRRRAPGAASRPGAGRRRSRDRRRQLRRRAHLRRSTHRRSRQLGDRFTPPRA